MINYHKGIPYGRKRFTMVKWYHVCRVTRYCANALTRDHVTTLADESASALYRGEVVSWCYGNVVSWCHSSVVSWRRGSVATNYHSSSAPETMRACWASWKLVFARGRAGKLRAASWSRNQKFNIILTKRAGKIFCHN